MKIKGTKIAITGADGFIGQALQKKLKERGAIILKISRSSDVSKHTIQWNPTQGILNRNSLLGIEAVIHLAGESIAERWTTEKRKKIIESRNIGTQLLCETLARVRPSPKVMIMASGSGYYKAQTDPHNESGQPANTFLSQVVSEWEAAATPAIDANIRVVKMRTGVVIGKGGGAIAKMLPFFKKGLGGKISDGQQKISWISLDDIVNAYIFALENEQVNGVINAVHPELINNKILTNKLAKSLNRPALFPIPSTLIKLLYGQMGEETLLNDNAVIPQKLAELGFEWEDTLNQALKKAVHSSK